MGLKIYSEQFINEILKLKLKTPPDIVLGLVNLSGIGSYTSYLDSLGKDASIKSDKSSVINKDPGNVIDIGDKLRNNIFNKNLPQNSDSDRGSYVNINDFNVTDPGDVVGDSTAIRDRLFAKNLDIPNEVSSYLSYYFLRGIGDPINVRDLNVSNPGDVNNTLNFNAEKERNRLFSRNKKISEVDPSENDPLYYDLSFGNYNYTSLLNDIGEDTLIRDLLVPNALSVSLESNQTPEISLNLLLQKNRYIPNQKSTFENITNELSTISGWKPYSDITNRILNGQYEPQKYEPSSFLNIRPLTQLTSALFNGGDLVSTILNSGRPVLTDDSLLMNIAALELKFNFESRIKQAIERETIGRTALDEALTNPIAAANIIRDPFRWGNLFERDYGISKSSNPIGRSAEFIASLGGFTNPINFEFNLSTDDDLTPKCFGNLTKYDGLAANSLDRFIDDLVGRTTNRRNNRDVFFLNRTGDGQKYSLFFSINKNKYQPDYLADYQSGVYTVREEIAQFFRGITGFLGLSGGRRPSGQYYIGSKNKGQDPFYLLQDGDGDQVRSTEELIKTLEDGTYYEPGYNEVSQYGSLETDFIWKAKNSSDSVLNENRRETNKIDWSRNVTNTSKLSFSNHSQDRFRECSILYKTSQLLEKGVTTIDQTLTKFGDEYSFTSRGNATISPIKTPIVGRDGNITGYNYFVPGLKNNVRDNEQMLYQAELCRVWTKTKPYSKISDLIRYKGLIRKERNSVLGANGNLSIFPSEFNSGNNSRTIEGQQSNPKKYMFSIENLAWRDHTPKIFNNQSSELPKCEQGPNGGRIMWFPPYEIQFSESTAANWTTHQFLGRPEPIYTYNNSERSGSLSWKIIVDHPSILNVLVKKELSRLSDLEVNEIIDAFWAGCVEFDTFELARIWSQFSQSEIDYFKLVLGEIKGGLPNSVIKTQMKNVDGFTPQQDVKINDLSTNSILPKSNVNDFSLFFENDVPLDPNVFNKKNDEVYDQGKIMSYHIYLDKYDKLNRDSDFNNSNELKKLYNTNIIVNPEKLTYHTNIGSGSRDNYFYTTNSDQNRYADMYGQYQKIEQDLKDTKYDGFNLTIELESHASPIGPENSDNYNNNLAQYRYISVVKWLLTVVLPANGRKIFTTNKQEITISNVDNIVTNETKNLLVLRENSNREQDEIRFVLKEATAKTVSDAVREIYGEPESINGLQYFKTPGIGGVGECFCFNDSKSVKTVVDNNLLPNVDNLLIGAVDPTGPRTDADIACSILSIIASYARRVTLNIEINQKPPKSPEKISNNNEPQNILLLSEEPALTGNVTKRDIAQRILDKLITECDYFDFLEENSPIVYKSLKEKLRYFNPSFHSMTPEGLNARLTFLQQCLRPGDTIKNEMGDSCDASNTAFGKPPVSILRIGDFYHTKIIITNLDITYDPLVFDLNPEGIGVQPMIANIRLQFKYIGGSGLRKHVDELQNALSFNYYANTDMYDDRTFANTNRLERLLINQEFDFFGNTLDLVPIVANAERFADIENISDTITGTIGLSADTPIARTPGGTFGNLLLNPDVFNISTVYQPYKVITFDSNFYVREFDDKNSPDKPNTKLGSPLSSPNLWERIEFINYGEEPFYFEFLGNNIESIKNTGAKAYFNTFKINYKPIFTELYDSYSNIIQSNVKINTVTENDVLLKLVVNKNYNSISNDVTIDQINNTANNITNNFTGLTINESFEKEANERGYVEFSKFNSLISNSELKQEKLNPIKAHLYPQKYLFKIGNGKSLVNSTAALNRGIFEPSDRFNPGPLSNNKNIPGIYLKDVTNYNSVVASIMNLFTTEYKNKIKSDLSHFWFYKDNVLFQKYLVEFESVHRDKLNKFLIDKFSTYIEFFVQTLGSELDNINIYNEKLTTLISGLSVILDGYDISATNVDFRLFEVIPNESRLSTKVNSLFGYDPYKRYELLISPKNSQERNIVTFNEVRNILDGNNTLDYLTLGNGLYFFKQISKYNGITNLVDQENYTSDNNLPVSWVFREGVDLNNETSPNFVYNATGITLNSSINKFGFEGVTNTYDIPDIFVSPLNEPDLNSGYYPMTYTFEKINYEFFDFTNKTLDIMIADNFINELFDYDIEYAIQDSLRHQLDDLNEPLDGERVLTAYLNNLFTIYRNGQNSSANLEYYQFKQTAQTAPIINQINEKLEYEFTITQTYLDTIPVINSSTSDVYGNIIKGKKIKLSGFLDMLFIGYLASITQSDIDFLKSELDKITPTKNISTNPITAKAQINRKKVRISKLTDDIYTSIQSYVKHVNGVTTPLYNFYNDSANQVKNNYNLILTGSRGKTIDKKTIMDYLLKGNDDDYTLTLKEAVKPNNINTIKRNYDVFTKNINRFNIGVN